MITIIIVAAIIFAVAAALGLIVGLAAVAIVAWDADPAADQRNPAEATPGGKIARATVAPGLRARFWRKILGRKNLGPVKSSDAAVSRALRGRAVWPGERI